MSYRRKNIPKTTSHISSKIKVHMIESKVHQSSSIKKLRAEKILALYKMQEDTLKRILEPVTTAIVNGLILLPKEELTYEILNPIDNNIYMFSLKAKKVSHQKDNKIKRK